MDQARSRFLGKGFLAIATYTELGRTRHFLQQETKHKAHRQQKNMSGKHWGLKMHEMIVRDLLDCVHMEARSQPRDGAKLGRVMRYRHDSKSVVESHTFPPPPGSDKIR